MKKMVVLTLVLGMAVLANAGLNWAAPDVVQVGDEFLIQLVNDETFPGVPEMGGFAIKLGDPLVAQFSGTPTINEADRLPGTWIVEDFGIDPEDPESGYWYFYTNTVPAVGETLEGVLGVIPVKALAEGSITIDLYDSRFEEILASLSFKINEIPEPASMLLLGLGGLLLRRK